jgi:hypothetical protein
MLVSSTGFVYRTTVFKNLYKENLILTSLERLRLELQFQHHKINQTEDGRKHYFFLVNHYGPLCKDVPVYYLKKMGNIFLINKENSEGIGCKVMYENGFPKKI